MCAKEVKRIPSRDSKPGKETATGGRPKAKPQPKGDTKSSSHSGNNRNKDSTKGDGKIGFYCKYCKTKDPNHPRGNCPDFKRDTAKPGATRTPSARVKSKKENGKVPASRVVRWDITRRSAQSGPRPLLQKPRITNLLFLHHRQ